MRKDFRSGFVVLALAAMLAWPAALSAGSGALTLDASGANGEGVSGAGPSCAAGGPGAFWSYRYEDALPGGEFTSVPGTLELLLDLRSEGGGGAYVGPESAILLENPRGALVLGMELGSCVDFGVVTFDGKQASGSGAWSVQSATGSYRDATGSGTFALDAEVGPGTGNLFRIRLNGGLAVLDPSLALEVASAAWEPGVQDGFRHALVTLRIRNAGPGDAYGVEVESASTPTPGALVVGAVPPPLGDIAAGAFAPMQLRFRFERGRPCASLTTSERGCSFEAALSVRMPDALDVAATHSQTVEVRVPTAPQQR